MPISSKLFLSNSNGNHDSKMNSFSRFDSSHVIIAYLISFGVGIISFQLQYKETSEEGNSKHLRSKIRCYIWETKIIISLIWNREGTGTRYTVRVFAIVIHRFTILDYIVFVQETTTVYRLVVLVPSI